MKVLHSWYSYMTIYLTKLSTSKISVRTVEKVKPCYYFAFIEMINDDKDDYFEFGFVKFQAMQTNNKMEIYQTSSPVYCGHT